MINDIYISEFFKLSKGVKALIVLLNVLIVFFILFDAISFNLMHLGMLLVLLAMSYILLRVVVGSYLHYEITKEGVYINFKIFQTNKVIIPWSRIKYFKIIESKSRTKIWRSQLINKDHKKGKTAIVIITDIDSKIVLGTMQPYKIARSIYSLLYVANKNESEDKIPNFSIQFKP